MDPVSIQQHVNAWKAFRRSRVGACGCIDTECILEKSEMRRNEQRLNERIKELQLCLVLKERELDELLLGKRRRLAE